MSIEPTNPVELPHPCAGLVIVAFENISTWPGHDKDPKFTKNPILFNDNNPLVRLADVKKLVDDLTDHKIETWRVGEVSKTVETVTRSQPSTGKADGWDLIEGLLDIWDDSERPEELRAYVEGTWKIVIDDLRTALLKHKGALT